MIVRNRFPFHASDRDRIEIPRASSVSLSPRRIRTTPIPADGIEFFSVVSYPKGRIPLNDGFTR